MYLLYEKISDAIEITALFIVCLTAFVCALTIDANDKLVDGFEKHADRVGLVLGLSIMAAGAILFVAGTAYHLFA